MQTAVYALSPEEGNAIYISPPTGSSTLDTRLQQQTLGNFTALPTRQTTGVFRTQSYLPSEIHASREVSADVLHARGVNLATANSSRLDEMSDPDKARLAEYHEMPESDKVRVAEYCNMTSVEKDKITLYSRMSEIEKAGSTEYSRLSFAEKLNIGKYAGISEIEKARAEKYCKTLDVVKARSSEYGEVSDIEKSMSAIRSGDEVMEPQKLKTNQLTQFGYNFFRADASGFASLTDIPVGDEYLVGPGDRIVLQLWGSVGGVYELEVNRSGEVFLPRVGAVSVHGVAFGRLPEILRSHLAREFKDFELNVNMGKLRLMKVYVVGEVKSPGDYNVSSLSTVINALSASGGPTKNGSLRNIQIKRLGKVAEFVDLYDFFLRGDKSRDIRLQPGDTIYVPVLKKVAGIAGNVRRSAIFELKNEKTLAELLVLADGINPTAYLQRVQIVRVQSHDKKVVSDFNLDPRGTDKSLLQITAGIKLQNLDVVRIFPIDTILRDHVRLEGHILRPGDYAFKEGMRVKNLIGNDNILPETYNQVAVITRLLAPDYHPEKITINLGKALAGDDKNNLELCEFDRLKIFSRWEMEEKPSVRISGEVQKPGEYRLLDNMRLCDLIYDSGNLKKTAFLENVEINRIKISSGGVTSSPIIVNLKEALNGNPDHNILLEPFDSVQIRRLPNWVEEAERYVSLSGEVMFPGSYPIYKGERLSSVLARAGGYTPKAYLRAAKFNRSPVRELQQKRMDEFIFKSEQEIGQKIQSLSAVASSKEELEATKASLEGLQRSLEKLKQLKPEGRVTIRLLPLEALRDSPYDLELMGSDSLEIPQSLGAVIVFGEVYNPSTLLHLPGKELSYYLNQAGGPSGYAETSEMYVVRSDGSVFSRQQSSLGIHWDQEGKKWTFGGFLATQLEPGDTIIVPKQLGKTAWMRNIKDITTIISQIALSAGTVFLGLR